MKVINKIKVQIKKTIFEDKRFVRMVEESGQNRNIFF